MFSFGLLAGCLAGCLTGCLTGCNDGGDEGDVGCDVPTSFKWQATRPLITPPEGSVSIKDPSVLFYNGKWHIYATHYAQNGGYSMVYLNFADWAQADAAEKIPVSTNPNLKGYKCAPQLFYFSPQDLWYLVYQTQEPAYSTTKDPTDVSSWSKATRFMPMPDIIENSEYGGIDYWIICDESYCYMFFSADNGVLYRARTPKSEFPNGFEGTTEIVMQQGQYELYEACNVYKMAGTGKYLLTVEAIGLNGRFFRSWTADRLDGEWTPLQDTLSAPFASINNVTGAEWSNDGISHGEMLRTNPDETMTINTCDMKFLFQGRTAAGKEYNLHEYSLGVLIDDRPRTEDAGQ
ncbi:MAG: glycosyl hydrolase family 62 [Deltaproteobacteria bacterium]|nr:glycosyl hydrolase family 62 [Deltaproteobacteria bacterium]